MTGPDHRDGGVDSQHERSHDPEGTHDPERTYAPGRPASLDPSTTPHRERSLPTTFRTAVTAFGAAVALGLLVAFGAGDLAAQQGPGANLASQSMRPYAHVFWAYALAWALVLGWVISIGRRWSRVEDDLQRRSGSESGSE